MPFMLHRIWFFACLICSISTYLHAADQTVDSSRFEITQLASGLIQPMELAVAPDGTVFFIEVNGNLKSINPVTHEVVQVGEIKITTEQENGLIGLALDPNFNDTHWIYLQYSPPDFIGQHISRFTFTDGQLDLASEKILLRYEEQRKECCHHAGSLHFGPRGELFIASGDNTHPHGDSQGYAPLDERPDKAPWDAQKSAANTQSYNGKILRIRPLADGTYEIPEGNLFPKDGSHGRPEIYAMGCRNPWRMTVDQKTGFVYWGEVGPDAGGDGPRGPRGYDEINQARTAGNFGWPYFIANNQPYTDVDFSTGTIGSVFSLTAPINDSPNNTGQRILPPPTSAFLYYPYGDSAEFPELNGPGGRTACAGPVYHFSEALNSNVKFPVEYDRSLFIYEWSRHWIKVVHLDENSHVSSIEPFMPNQKFLRPIDMAFGPEGALYVIEYGETWGVNSDARLLRIDYVRGNRAPVVVASVENNIGKEPLTLSVSSAGTFDKDIGDLLQYEWRLINTVNQQAAPKIVANEPQAEITLDVPGIYNLELVVTDAHGESRSAVVPAVVGNARPVIRFTKPVAGDFFDAHEPIRYELFVKDAEDGTNDDYEMDVNNVVAIDPDSPSRVSVNAVFANGPLPAASPTAGTKNDGPPGLRRMKSSDCFNCHAVDQKRVGPPLLDVANKYRDKEGALEASIERVMKGSTGAWGKIPMIPHSHHTVEEVREMVSWIYSLEPSGLVRVFGGFVAEIPVDPKDESMAGYYRLEATYTDLGAGTIPPLSASTVMLLRQRLVEAESADEIQGPQVLASGTAGGGQFMGAINHGHTLRFRDIAMDEVGAVTCRVASAGAGGQIEVRLDRPDGELLATADIEVNGQWEQWYDRQITLTKTPGTHDVIIRFVHPQQAGGLMNLDSIHFQR